MDTAIYRELQALKAKAKYIDVLCKAGHDYNDLPTDLSALRDLYVQEIGPVQAVVIQATANGSITRKVVDRAA